VDRCFLLFDFCGTGVDVLCPTRSFTISNVGDCKLSVHVELAGHDRRTATSSAVYSFSFTPERAVLSQKKALTLQVKLTCLKPPNEEATAVYSLTLERRNKKSAHQMVRVRYFVVLHVQPLAQTQRSPTGASAASRPAHLPRQHQATHSLQRAHPGHHHPQQQPVHSESIVHALSAYVPNCVLRRYAGEHAPPSAPHMSRFEAAILFIDISGFTSLNERLAQLGAQGPEQVSRHVNRYFGQLIKAVNRHGGDVLKFAGDALICQFGDERSERALRQLVLRALQCGLEIQTDLAEYDSGEGFHLTLHVGVGAGTVNALHVGGEQGRWEHLVVGDPLIQLKTAVDLSGPGEVVVSPECWALVCQQCRGRARQTDYLVEEVLRPLPVQPLEEVTPVPRMENALRCYVQKPAQAFLDSWQGSWLAELRDVTVLFVNLTGIKIRRGCDVDLAELQQVLCEMQRVVFSHEGMVRQFLADDKGTVLIAAFLAHEDSPVRGVQTALEIHRRLGQLQVANTVGITTGKVFCGSVGSEVRREYAMVGDIVNLSARLMVAALHQRVDILCDGSTMHACRGRFDFTALEPLHLKGKAHPVPVFVPKTRTRSSSLASSSGGNAAAHALSEQRGEHARSPSDAAPQHAAAPADVQRSATATTVAAFPLTSASTATTTSWNARREVDYGIVGRASVKRELCTHLEKACAKQRNLVVVFEGTPGIGKTSMARFCRAVAREAGTRVYRGAADSIHTTVPFFAWQGVVRALLADVTVVAVGGGAGALSSPGNADGSSPGAVCLEVMAALRVLAGEQHLNQLPLLNHLLELEPPLQDSELTAGLTARERTLHTTALLLHLLRRQTEAHQAPLLLSFDDLQWMDYSSLWLVAEALRDLPSLQLVLTARPQAQRQPAFEEVVQHSRALLYTLAGLSVHETARLVQLRLGLPHAAAVPADLRSFVHENSQGNPFFAEELLQGLLEANALAVDVPRGRCDLLGDLTHYRPPDTVQGVVNSRISNLKPSLQMALKVASVIGQEFTRAQLRNVFPIEQERFRLPAHLALLQRLQFINTHQPPGALQRVYSFKSALIRECAYNRMLFSQRQLLHRAIAEYLEDNHLDNLAPVYPTLAHHWSQVLLSYEQKQLPSYELVRKAIDYIVRSGEQASADYANREAHKWFARGLEVLSTLPTPNYTVAKRLGINPHQMTHCMVIHLLGMRVRDLAGFGGLRQQRDARAVCGEHTPQRDGSGNNEEEEEVEVVEEVVVVVVDEEEVGAKEVQPAEMVVKLQKEVPPVDEEAAVMEEKVLPVEEET
jgi:class 3 adenylate cyclase